MSMKAGEVHSKIIQWLRWPLRGLASVTIVLFTFNTTLLSLDFTKIMPSSGMQTSKEAAPPPIEPALANISANTLTTKPTDESKNINDATIDAGKRNKKGNTQEAPHDEIDATYDDEAAYDTILFKNECNKNIMVAVHYYPNANANDWITKGWWEIPAHKETL